MWLESGSVLSATADSASAIAYTLDTDNALSTVGSKLLSVKNNGTEKMYLDKDGNLYVSGNIISGSGSYTLLATNKSGGTVATKSIVVIDESNNSAFTTTTTPYTTGAFGVVVGVGLGVSNDANGDGICDADDICVIAVNGEVEVTTINASTANKGDYVFTSDTAGSAIASGKQYDGLVGIVTDTSGSGSGYVKIVFKAQPQVTAVATLDKYTKHNIYQEALENYVETNETDYWNNLQNFRKGVYFDALVDESKIDYSSNTSAVDINNRKAGLWGGATLNATNTDSAGNTFLGAADANDVYYYDRTQSGQQGRDSTPATLVDLGTDPNWYNGISLVNPATGSGTLVSNPPANLTEQYNGGLIKVENTITTEDGYIDIEIVSQTNTTLTFNWRTSTATTYSGDQLDTAVFGQSTSLVDDTSATDTNIDVTFSKVNYHPGDTFRIASWYIEPATANDRGSKQQFPERSNIIAGDDYVDIIDADTNLLWMRFNEGSTNYLPASTRIWTSTQLLNGTLQIGAIKGAGGIGLLVNISFSNDTGTWTHISSRWNIDSSISKRNTSVAYTETDQFRIVDGEVNDVHSAVIPNQPTQEMTVSGWGYMQGIASDTMTESVNLLYKFNSIPTVRISNAGKSGSGVPTNLSSCTDGTLGGGYEWGAEDFTTTSFTAGAGYDDSSNFNTSHYYCYTWTATGVVSPRTYTAVATDGGVSVINETDQSVIDMYHANYTDANAWDATNVVLLDNGDLYYTVDDTADDSADRVQGFNKVGGITSDNSSDYNSSDKFYTDTNTTP
ncbi:MAG: hypothetical protein V3S69_00005, partial [Dehalococcoidales bacterium]